MKLCAEFAVHRRMNSSILDTFIRQLPPLLSISIGVSKMNREAIAKIDQASNDRRIILHLLLSLDSSYLALVSSLLTLVPPSSYASLSSALFITVRFLFPESLK